MSEGRSGGEGSERVRGGRTVPRVSLDGLHQSEGHPDEDGQKVEIASEGDVADRAAEGAGYRRMDRSERDATRVSRPDQSKGIRMGSSGNEPPRMSTSAGWAYSAVFGSKQTRQA